MKSTYLTMLALSALCLTNALAVDPKTPVTPPPITIGSEFDRGMGETPDELSVSVVEYHDAFNAVLKHNKELNRDTDAFELGIYYGAWHRLWTSLSVGLYREKTAHNLVAGNANFFFTMARQIQKNIGLSDEDVKKMSGGYYSTDENNAFPAAVKSGQFKDTMRDAAARDLASRKKK